jgi:hypothetical protein
MKALGNKALENRLAAFVAGRKRGCDAGHKRKSEGCGPLPMMAQKVTKNVIQGR